MGAGATAVARPGLVQRVIGGIGRRVADARARRVFRAEIDALDRAGTLDGVLGDLEMTRADIETLVQADPGAARRLAAMTARLGLTDALRRRAGPATAREIELVCTRCAATNECEHWLSGDKDGGNEQFCPNAGALEALRQ